jgi:hypothetical protein
MKMKARSVASTLLAISLTLGVAGSASATFIQGEVSVLILSNIVDTDNDIVLGGSAFAQSASGDLSFLSGQLVTLSQFYYQGPNVVLPTVILHQGSAPPGAGDLVATAATIDLVVENSNLTGELLSLLGTGTLSGAGFEPTAMTWSLDVSETADVFGAFTLTAEGDPGGTGTGSTPTPEPSAALLFGIGLLVAARSIRRA